MQEAVSYTIHTRLGKGGFGEVYLATQNRGGGLKRQVAIKLLKAEIGQNSEAVKRLVDEGAMLAMLRHPAIVVVHELTRVAGRLALITEYVDGIDVSKRCAAPDLLPSRVAWEIGAEVASALDCAWNTLSEHTGKPLNLIHRDIKPENVRISRHGEVKLLDFGIARSSEIARQAETAAGQLPFTPGYVPPEVFLRGDVNGTTDIYALGCTMYRLLTGEKLYARMDLAQTVQLAVMRDEYEQWLTSRLKAVGSERGKEVLARFLAYAQEDRPSAGEAAQLCEEVADRQDGPSRRRWARSQEFPVASEVPEGQLAGMVVNELTLSIARPDIKLTPMLAGDRQPVAPEGTPAPVQEATPSPRVDPTPTTPVSGLQMAPPLHAPTVRPIDPDEDDDSGESDAPTIMHAYPSRTAEPAPAVVEPEQRRSARPPAVRDPEPPAVAGQAATPSNRVGLLVGALVLALVVLALVLFGVG